MQSIEATLLISAGFVGILTLFVLFTTGSLVAVLALWIVTSMIVLVLWYYGFIDLGLFTVSTLKPDPPPAAETPEPADVGTVGGPQVGSEVFHIDDAQFTYADAPAVCAAHGAELATLEQIIDAYNHGAEWCSYGWSLVDLLSILRSVEHGNLFRASRTRFVARPAVVRESTAATLIRIPSLVSIALDSSLQAQLSCLFLLLARIRRRSEQQSHGSRQC